MPWLRFEVKLENTDPVPVEALLLDAGALAVTLKDAGDDPILEPAVGTTPHWPQTRVSGLFQADADADIIRCMLHDSLGELPTIDTQILEDKVWEREWLTGFKPMRFGKRLWVRPSECEIDAEDAVSVILDPGLAFVTGTHPTTALCLEWLDAADCTGSKFLDFGCGSGILGIAALKLGADEVTAVDVDEQALVATSRNATRNEVGKRLRVVTADAELDPPYDIVVANILAQPLIDLAERLSSLLPTGGRAVLSGILESQWQSVQLRYATWFQVDAPVVREEWVRLECRKN